MSALPRVAPEGYCETTHLSHTTIILNNKQLSHYFFPLYSCICWEAWVCDNCQVASFQTFDEAEKHEALCDCSLDHSLMVTPKNKKTNTNYTTLSTKPTSKPAIHHKVNTRYSIVNPPASEEYLKNNSGVEENDSESDESMEAIKQSILGLGLRMYNIDRKLLARNIFRPIKKTPPSSTSDNSSIDKDVYQNLLCQVCCGQLYNPTSLLCGHSFCMTCLELCFDSQVHVNKTNDKSPPIGNANNKRQFECPTCNEPVPILNNKDSGANIPNMKVNMALKVALDIIHSTEYNAEWFEEETAPILEGEP